MAFVPTHAVSYRPDLALAPEVYNHLRGLQKKAKDLRIEVRTLRRLSQAQAIAVREDIKDTYMRIRATLLANSGVFSGQGDHDKMRLTREEELYKQEVIRLENDLGDLESSVEILRGEVINRRTRGKCGWIQCFSPNVNYQNLQHEMIMSRHCVNDIRFDLTYFSLHSPVNMAAVEDMALILSRAR